MRLKRSIARIHGIVVHDHRVTVLCDRISSRLVGMKSVVDVGCGDGRIISFLAARLPQIQFRGFEVPPLRRSLAAPVEVFNGRKIPLPDRSVDAVILVDVLHHADDPFALLAEACRVAKSLIIIKDHRISKPGATSILRMMDWVGNWAHDVKMPHHYWTESQWREAWHSLGLKVSSYETELRLYPRMFRPLFENGLHFLASLEKDQRP
jgi:SAM-dependent methyltransferase